MPREHEATGIHSMELKAVIHSLYFSLLLLANPFNGIESPPVVLVVYCCDLRIHSMELKVGFSENMSTSNETESIQWN